MTRTIDYVPFATYPTGQLVVYVNERDDTRAEATAKIAWEVEQRLVCRDGANGLSARDFSGINPQDPLLVRARDAYTNDFNRGAFRWYEYKSRFNGWQWPVRPPLQPKDFRDYHLMVGRNALRAVVMQSIRESSRLQFGRLGKRAGFQYGANWASTSGDVLKVNLFVHIDNQATRLNRLPSDVEQPLQEIVAALQRALDSKGIPSTVRLVREEQLDATESMDSHGGISHDYQHGYAVEIATNPCR